MLATIIALARAGATRRASTLYEAGGFSTNESDPVVLAVKGRLLKGLAFKASQTTRSGLFRESAAVYAAAHSLRMEAYYAINAASMYVLAGDVTAAFVHAQLALDDLSRTTDSPSDTPYFLAATRAEALLILGDLAGAKVALIEAADLAPDAFDDRAVTLMQLISLCSQLGVDQEWLEALYPPTAVHFGGHMGISRGGAGEKELSAAVDAFAKANRVGFAFGALAAGSDIIMAEAFLAAGCALHIVLPAPAEIFMRRSVTLAGDGWASRFSHLLARASSLRVIGEDEVGVHEPAISDLAGETAIGGAVILADRYRGRALQLLCRDPEGGGAQTRRLSSAWPNPNSRHVVTIPRDFDVKTAFPADASAPWKRDVSIVSIRIGVASEKTLPSPQDLERKLAPLGEALKGIPKDAVRVGPGRWDIVLDRPEVALRVAARVLASYDHAEEQPLIGLARGVATLTRDDVTGRIVAYGPVVDLSERLAQAAPPGVALASETFAVPMAGRAQGRGLFELWFDADEAFDGAVYVMTSG